MLEYKPKGMEPIEKGKGGTFVNKPFAKPDAKPVLHHYRKAQPLHLPAERRECKRRIVHERCDVIVTLIQPGTDDAAVIAPELTTGIVTDMSPKGIGLNLVHMLEPNSIVELDVRGHAVHGKLKARVAWSAQVPTLGHVIKANPRPWRAGVQFILESDQDKELMQKLVETL
jgi:hypothetical protein